MKKRKQNFGQHHEKVENPHSYDACRNAMTDFMQNWQFDMRDIDHVNPGANEEDMITQTSPVKISKMDFGQNKGDKATPIFDGEFGMGGRGGRN